MKNLYRRYKISQITNEGISAKEKEIVDFILDKIKDLTTVDIDNNFLEFVNSKGVVIFLLDEKYNISWFNNEFFWEVLENRYSLKYDDIRSIIKDIVEHSYKINIGTPYCDKDNIDR